MQLKARLLTTAALGAFLLGTGLPSVVGAADLTTDAEIIVAGGNLGIETQPTELTFAPIALTNLATETITTQAETVSTLDIGDYRGTDPAGGWTLTANLSEFKGQDETPISGVSLALAATPESQKALVATGESDYITETSPVFVSPELAAGGAEAVIWKTDADHLGLGRNELKDITGKLTILPQNTLFAGDYSATLAWTLVSQTTDENTPAPVVDPEGE